MENDPCLTRMLNAPKKERVVTFSLIKLPGASKKKRTVRQPNLKKLRSVPSLIFPDDVEKTSEVGDESVWAFLRDFERIHHKFLNCTPKDVASVKEKDFLSTERTVFACLPAAQLL